MGKPPASCFKIIRCGGDSVDHDDLQSPEIKGSSERTKWSFRQRSSSHRILSNNVGSETPPSANKEHPESPAVIFQVQSDLTVPEKTPVIQLTEEKTEFPAQLESKLCNTPSPREDDCKSDEIANEPSIIIIQAGIRKFLAEQVLLKQKNIIRLQAAVRLSNEVPQESGATEDHHKENLVHANGKENILVLSDIGVKAGLDRVSSDTSALQIGSECGTALSISSTLDSPDRSINGIEHEMNVVSDEPEGQPKSGEFFEVEFIEKSPTLHADPSFTNTNDSKRYETSINSDTAKRLNSISDEDSPHVEKKQEANLSGQQLDLEPEASPRSHSIVPESQTTPSSQVLIKPKKIKGEKSQHNRKKKSSSADKNCNQDSISRSNLEELQEHKSGKRQNSFVSSKPEHEPREKNSSSSLPSYMQATESAKAKALLVANGSMRSSPDLYDNDIYIKKRHSLPGGNERQGSPRIHRSLSQAQKNAKGNATNSPQDQK